MIAHQPITYAAGERPNYNTLAEQIADCDPSLLQNLALESTSEKWEVTKLQERHREIIRLLVLGYTNKEVADTLGCSAVMVSYVRNSKLVQAKIEALHGIRDVNTMKISDRIQNLGGIAINVLEEALESNDTSLNMKIKIAQDLLDRAGHKPVARIVADINHSVLNNDDLLEIKQRAERAQIGERNQLPVLETEAL